jgi:hypothetical protein
MCLDGQRLEQESEPMKRKTPIDARINKSLDEYVKINEIVVKHMDNSNARKF